MDDFEEFLLSTPATPQASNVSVLKSASNDVLDDFFSDMEVATLPAASSASTDNNLFEADTQGQSALEHDGELSTEIKVSDQSTKPELIVTSVYPDSIAPTENFDADSNQVDLFSDPMKSSPADEYLVTPSKLPTSPTVVCKTEDDEFDDIFGDTTSTPKISTTVDIPKKMTEEDEADFDFELEEDSMSTKVISTPTRKEIGISSPKTVYSTEYEELFGSASPITDNSTIKSDDAIHPKLALSIENELNDEPTATATATATAHVATTPIPTIGVVSAPLTPNMKKDSSDDDEFLSWLGDSTNPLTPPVNSSATASSHSDLPSRSGVLRTPPEKDYSRVDNSSGLDSALMSPTQSQSKVKALMDNFFDDLFGGAPRSSMGAEQITPIKAKISHSDFEMQLQGLIASNFVDVPQLRRLLLEGGYIPRSYRGQVWCLLLTGYCSQSEDVELEDFESNSFTRSNFSNRRAMLSDCESVTASHFSDMSSSSSLQFKQHLVDILTLYCIRKERNYSSVLCSVLAPLLLPPNNLPKGLASSCFYSLASEFLPLLSLSSAELEPTLDLVHSWLRLLVVYHSPAVAQHLDRTLPGWESAAPLDLACEDIGTDAASSSPSDSDSRNSMGATWTVKGVKKTEPWGIPLTWICGIFAGSLPAEQSSFLLDWALVNQQSYAGMLCSFMF